MAKIKRQVTHEFEFTHEQLKEILLKDLRSYSTYEKQLFPITASDLIFINEESGNCILRISKVEILDPSLKVKI